MRINHKHFVYIISLPELAWKNVNKHAWDSSLLIIFDWSDSYLWISRIERSLLMMTSDWCQGGSVSPCLRTFLARCDAWHGVTLSARDSPTLVTPSSDALCDSCRGKWYQNMKTLQGSNYHETVATHPGAAGWYLSWRVESADKSLWVFWHEI